ncbi:DNA-binding transcriptional regulator, MerR family [Geodermatophilus amargosae]|uniref:DNA-binding transcriptional regulator, MerR family n=1 Tax=Geodermatophilus amargosae TaxID=1296565 RepID=A0A1I6X419_9ACTN|nr:DNA-binding transcriptional regulator, MerR family [Geodermatophilus amargosae]
MAAVTTAPGIREVSEHTGLSIDTLRWYEREGLIPLVERTPTGRRSYPPAALRFIRLVQVLRRTGMPVADVRHFMQLGEGRLEHHPTRMALLESQRRSIERQVDQVHGDLAVLTAKIDQYRDLIARGLDCEDEHATRVVCPGEEDARHLAGPRRPATPGRGGGRTSLRSTP